MKITILGSGCPSCRLLEAQAKKVGKELGLKDAQVEHIYDIEKIIDLPSMLGVSRVIGLKKVLNYAVLMWILGIIGGLIFAYFV